jgi:hypothetical protein
MAGNLVAIFDHTADETWPWCSRVVDGAFTEVSTGDVKCSSGVVSLRVLEMTVSYVLCVAHLEEIKKVFGVGVRPIIIRQSNVAIAAAPVDGLAIRNTANLGSSNVGSIRSSRANISIAARTILDLARGSRAVEISSSAPSEHHIRSRHAQVNC